MASHDKTQVGRRLAEVREAQGYDQKAFAGMLGMSPSALCKIEKGERGLDSLVLYRAAELLDVALSEFFPAPTGQEQLMLARQGIGDGEALQAMTDWSVKVLKDLDFVEQELARA